MKSKNERSSVTMLIGSSGGGGGDDEDEPAASLVLQEAQERYDDFNSSRKSSLGQLIMIHNTRSSANKSPISDEGIETDSDRSKTCSSSSCSSSAGSSACGRGSVSRCWSIDSAVTSEEDYNVVGIRAGDKNYESARRQKLRVTRCCSSDSAVLSDDDQNKGVPFYLCLTFSSTFLTCG